MAAKPCIRGMILAAGFGTRLSPITDHLPKPLLPVAGITLLDHAVATFDRGGIDDIAVNSHHLGEMIASQLDKRSDSHRFSIFHETEILGTGGALHGARKFLEAADHFVVFNGDVLCDVDLSALVDAHLENGGLATLLLVAQPQFNTVHIGEDNSVVHIQGAGPLDEDKIPAGCRALTYAGIGVFSRRLLDDIGPGFSSLITPLVTGLVADPGCVKGFPAEDIFWNDLGTLSSYLRVCNDVDTSSRAFSWLNENPGATAGPLKINRITGHGSNRSFWRMNTAQWSSVAMQSAAGQADDEFIYQINIGRFLHRHDLGTAAILSVDEPNQTLLMEDLGQASLLFLSQNPGTPAHLLADRYRQVVDHLLRLQAFTETARAECPSAVARCLDHEVLLWETAYFRERFLHGHLGLKEKDTQHLVTELEALAHCVANQPQVLLHRDFQSQNIHFQGGKVRLVDIQGMRLGPLGYDIMSLVWDPYVDLPAELREELLGRFAAGCGEDVDDVRVMALAAGLQRLMQALGAYGFLGHVKGKPEFLKHIPQGVKNLRMLLDEAGSQCGGASPWLPESLERLSELMASSV
jgi:mannose-1-phosphate guanylyltransferase